MEVPPLIGVLAMHRPFTMEAKEMGQPAKAEVEWVFKLEVVLMGWPAKMEVIVMCHPAKMEAMVIDDLAKMMDIEVGWPRKMESMVMEWRLQVRIEVRVMDSLVALMEKTA